LKVSSSSLSATDSALGQGILLTRSHSLISACGSDVLLAAHAAAYDRYLRYQMIAVVFRGEIAAREHQALLEAALVRDWKQAQKIMVSHIRGCVEHALKEDNAGLFGGQTTFLHQESDESVPKVKPEQKSLRRPTKSAAAARSKARGR
jgi:hypothetical protein